MEPLALTFPLNKHNQGFVAIRSQTVRVPRPRERDGGAFVALTSSPVRELSGIENHFCFSFDYG